LKKSKNNSIKNISKYFKRVGRYFQSASISFNYCILSKKQLKMKISAKHWKTIKSNWENTIKL
jgi:hypothetical protein